MSKLTLWATNRKAMALWDRSWSDAEEGMTAAVFIYRNQVLP